MSYNIDAVTLVACARRLTITSAEVHKWMMDLAQLPESASDMIAALDRKDLAVFDITDKFTWCGEGSGHGYSETLVDFAASTEGDASYVLTWEGGDSHTGLRIVDGKAYKHEVVQTLGELKGEL